MKKIIYLFLILAVIMVIIGCQSKTNNGTSGNDYESIDGDVAALDSLNDDFNEEEINDLDKDLELGDDY